GAAGRIPDKDGFSELLRGEIGPVARLAGESGEKIIVGVKALGASVDARFVETGKDIASVSERYGRASESLERISGQLSFIEAKLASAETSIRETSEKAIQAAEKAMQAAEKAAEAAAAASRPWYKKIFK
ncbi:MAG: hypothetical protein LBW85_03070, partial [Deltaproteobacteria bacterium]|nr:hypothetical protein [Deltaproteobacteria bacterium]